LVVKELTYIIFSSPSKAKDSNTYAFSEAEAWQHLTVKKVVLIKLFEMVSWNPEHIFQLCHAICAQAHW